MSDIKNKADSTAKAGSTASSRGDGAAQSLIAKVQGLFSVLPGPLLGLILVSALFTFMSPYFLTSRNQIGRAHV